MVHTYEVFVDVKEFADYKSNDARFGSTRYEIDAESRSIVDVVAFDKARSEYPKASEYDIRITRLLK
ncbi:hypothetical protein CAL7716_029040 [Calothrix sp. PCC 7716]|nr:hypothetical protein CAL7716_029040 [Calothrix sp. PCC 7716]